MNFYPVSIEEAIIFFLLFVVVICIAILLVIVKNVFSAYKVTLNESDEIVEEVINQVDNVRK